MTISCCWCRMQGADDRSRSPVNARLGPGGSPSKKAEMSAEFVAT